MFSRAFLFLGLMFLCLTGYGQQEDFRTWWAAEVSGELLKTIDVKVSPEVRFKGNSRQFSNVLTDFDASYPFLKYFKIGGKYRFEKLQTKEEYTVNRFGIYFRARYRVNDLRTSYRAIYHWELSGVNTREVGNVPDEFHRHKISFSYYKKKWNIRPEAAFEYFINRSPLETKEERKIRASIGFEYRINKNISASLNYKYQQEFFENNPLTAHIIATTIGYRW